MINLFFYDVEGDEEMYQDTAPQLPRVIVMESPRELPAFQKQIDDLEYLGIEIEVATADILDNFRNLDDAVFNLAVSGYEMYSSHEWSELHDDVQKYIEARQTYGLSLLRMLTQHGLYVNGILHYQLRHVNNQLMMLEKLQIPLTDVQLHKRNLARQADLASRRVVSAFDARTAIPRNR